MNRTVYLLALFVIACDGGDDKADPDTGAEDCVYEPTGELPPVALDCDAFSAALVLSDDPERPVDYLVDCTPNVTDLTIEAGAVVAFAEEAGLKLTSGALTIQGEECRPAILQGAVAEPGHWRGILIDSDPDAPTAVISHAEIRHAGGEAFNSNGDLGSIILWADSLLVLEDTRISESAANGLNMSYGGATVTMARNRFEDNSGYAILSEPEYAAAMDGETTFTNNGTDGMSMFGGEVSSDGATWVATTAPYRVLEGGVVAARGPLTLEAGVEVRFAPESGISLTRDGALHTAGEAEAPVVLAGETESRGAWQGVIVDTDDTSHLLEYTEIRHAGGGAFNSNGDLGGLIVWAGNTVTLDTVTISDSAAYGLNLSYPDSDVTLTGSNTFTGNAWAPVLLLPEYGAALTDTSSYTGNDDEFVLVIAEDDVFGDNTWQALGVPWRLRSFSKIFFHVNINEGASLTFAPGAEVVAEQDTGFEAYQGSLVVDGTDTNPVIFQGAEGQTWSGFFFDDPRGDGEATHSINHAEIYDAGSVAFNSNGDRGAVVVWANTEAVVSNTYFEGTVSKCAINAPYTDDEVDVGGSASTDAQLLCDED